MGLYTLHRFGFYTYGVCWDPTRIYDTCVRNTYIFMYTHTYTHCMYRDSVVRRLYNNRTDGYFSNVIFFFFFSLFGQGIKRTMHSYIEFIDCFIPPPLVVLRLRNYFITRIAANTADNHTIIIIIV